MSVSLTIDFILLLVQQAETEVVVETEEVD